MILLKIKILLKSSKKKKKTKLLTIKFDRIARWEITDKINKLKTTGPSKNRTEVHEPECQSILATVNPPVTRHVPKSKNFIDGINGSVFGGGCATCLLQHQFLHRRIVFGHRAFPNPKERKKNQTKH